MRVVADAGPSMSTVPQPATSRARRHATTTPRIVGRRAWRTIVPSVRKRASSSPLRVRCIGRIIDSVSAGATHRSRAKGRTGSGGLPRL